MNKNTIKSVGYLTLLKIIGSVTGLTYAVLQVRYFGASSMVDAFFIATSALYLISSLVQGGQLSEVFLPEYLEKKNEKGAEAAYLLLSIVLNRVAVALLVAISVFYLIAPFLIAVMGAGLEVEQQLFAVDVLRLSLVLVVFNIIASFVNSTLLAEQIYGRSEWTSLINSLFSLLVLVLFHKILGIWALLLALMVGKIVEFVIGLYYLNRIGYKYSLKWNMPGYNMNAFFKVLYTTSGYVGSTQVYNVILTSMSSFLPAGSFSIYNYVLQLSNKTKGIVINPISTVFFSKFANSTVGAKNKNVPSIGLPLLAIGIVALLQFCLVFSLGTDLLRFLWSEKSLSAEELTIATLMLTLNLIGVIISAMGAIYRKAVVALKGAKLLYRGWIVSQLVTAIYSFIVIYYFSVYGLISIPMVNMLLLASVSVFVSRSYDLQIFSGEQKKVQFKKWIAFSVLALFMSIMLNQISFTYSIIIYSLILKGVILFIMITGVGWLFVRKDVQKIIYNR
jgi:putative peptidoglycan lipid II flippase